MLALRPGEVSVSLDVTKRAELKRGQSRRSPSTPSRMGTTVEKKDPVEVLVVIVIAVLVLGVAIGPLLAMRNPAEADKLTPGADPAGESSKEPDASESSIESPTPRHTEDQP